jgi:transglutaminase-like putative cysteine protease
MIASDRLTVAAASAVLLSSSALAPLYADWGWLLPVAGAVVVVALAGAFSRRIRVPVLFQPVLGATALAAYTVVYYAGGTLAYGALPTPATTARIRTVIGEGLLDVDVLAPPVPTSAGLVLLAVLGIGAVALVVDLVAVALDRPAAAGLPLLLVFAVPSATLAGGVGWLPFVLGAAGWLGLLLVEGGDRLSRWGMPLRPDRRAPAYDDPGVGRVGRRIGAAALGVAVVVPALVPGLDNRLFGSGDGIGLGGGSRTTTTYNPITQLGGQLRLPVPRTLLTYRTDDPTPDYLRLTTLDLYDGSQWSSSELTASRDDDAVENGIPEPVGVDTSTTAEGATTEITIAALGGPWLPVTFPPKEVELDGPWLWDAEADTVFSTRRDLSDLDAPYRVVTHRVDPQTQELREPEETLPPELDPYVTAPEVTDYVRELINKQVAGAATPYDQVVALQNFFTDSSNGFRYSESSTVPGTQARDALENFLRPGGRVGFCEQYASAMAAMVRVLGLPARVGVGFTPGTPQGDGVFEVTTDDAHAWPEVWFAGSGWLRFEPTPRAEQVTTPAYTRPSTPQPDAADEPAAQAPAPATPLGADGRPLNPDGNTPLEGDGLPGAAGDEEEAWVSLLRWTLLGALVLAAVGLAPLLLAGVRRRLRWRSPSAALAWQQVHDDAVDVGHRWEPAESPRAAAARIEADRRLPAPAAASLARLAGAVERERYGPPRSSGADGPAEEALHGDAQRVRAALLAGATRRERWKARLLPASTLRWAASSVGGAVADLLDRQDDALAAVGRRLRRRPRRA